MDMGDDQGGDVVDREVDAVAFERVDLAVVGALEEAAVDQQGLVRGDLQAVAAAGDAGGAAVVVGSHGLFLERLAVFVGVAVGGLEQWGFLAARCGCSGRNDAFGLPISCSGTFASKLAPTEKRPLGWIGRFWCAYGVVFR